MRRLAAVLLLVAGLAVAAVAVPPLAARVTDLTGTLTAEQRAALESRLAAFEAQKGSQIAVLVVPTTAPEEIEQYSIRVAEAWKLGRKGVDDGVLFLVAKDDRRLRLEVGYGLEGALPDAIANRIIQETVVPYLRRGDFYGGISAGVERVIAVVNGEPLPEPRRERQDGGGAGLGQLLPLAIVFVFWFGAALKRLLGQLPGSAVTGTIVGVVAWLIVGALAVGLVAGIAAFVFALLVGAGGGRRWSSGGPWVGGGGFGGGGFGGGGFGGGGGGFGGGGASGRW